MADHSQLDNLAKVAADVLNEVSKLAHGSGLISLIGLYPDASIIGSEDWNAAKAQVASLSDEDRQAVEQVFINALNLENKVNQAKITNSVTLLDSAFALVEQVMPLVKKAEELVVEAKNLLS